MNRGVVSSQSIFVIAIVDCYFDANAGIDEANDCSWDADEVRIATVSSTSEAVVGRSQQRY